MRGVTFGNIHSYDDLGLFMSDRPTIQLPEAKLFTVDIPGGDGYADLTESLVGEVKYENRELEFNFMIPADIDEQAEVYTKVYNAIHGKKLKIVLDEDPEYYYVGRCSIKPKTKDAVMEFTIKADCEPYKYELGTRTYTANLDAVEVTTVQVAGDNVSEQDWNTDLRFGTATIPAHDFSVYQSLTLSWEATNHPPSINIVDATGKAYAVTLDVGVIGHKITSETLEAAGIDMSKIYRVLVSYGPNAVLQCETMPCVSVEVEGTPKTAVPVFTISNSGITMWFNGKQYELEAGMMSDPDIVVKNGTNTMLFVGTEGTVKIEFQGGYL